jgi:hypothetical protein
MNYTLLYKVYMMQYYRVYRSLNQALLNLFFFGYLFLLFALTARSFFIALTVSVVKTCQIQAPFKSTVAFENPPTSLKTRQVRRVQIRRCIWKSSKLSKTRQVWAQSKSAGTFENQPTPLKTRQLGGVQICWCTLKSANFSLKTCWFATWHIQHVFAY